MHYLDNPVTDPFFNLATEEYLLKHSGKDIFILGQNAPSVIVGKHQHPQTEADLSRAANQQIPVLRRISGGGTVYQDLGNFNLTFLENTSSPVFGKYTRLLTDFLTKNGIPAQADERNAVFIGNLKISGSAQCIYKNRLLHHATLLFSTDLNLLKELLDVPETFHTLPSESAVRSVKNPVTNLSSYLRDHPTLTEFRKRILHHFQGSGPPLTLTPEELKNIQELAEKKYRNPDWIYGKIS